MVIILFLCLIFMLVFASVLFHFILRGLYVNEQCAQTITIKAVCPMASLIFNGFFVIRYSWRVFLLSFTNAFLLSSNKLVAHGAVNGMPFFFGWGGDKGALC